jgi:hypothetical protein
MIEQTDWSAHVVVKVYIVLLWTPRFVICTVAVKTNISSSLIMNFALGLYNFKHYLRESLGHYFKYRREKPQWLKVWIFSTASLGMSHIDHGTSVFLFLFNLPTLSIYIFKEIYWLKTKLLKKFKFLSLGLSSYLHSYKNATIKEMFWKRVYMFNSSCLWGDWVERFLNIVMEIEVIFLFFLSKNWLLYWFTFQMLSLFLVSPPETLYLILPPASMRVLTHLPTHSCLPILAFPYTGAWSLPRTKVLSSHWCPTRPSFVTYAAGVMEASMCTLCWWFSSWELWGESGWLILLLFLWGCKPFQLLKEILM